MPAFTDKEYRARELLREERILRGNAVNAAAQLHSGTGDSGAMLETAAMLEEYLRSAAVEDEGQQPTLQSTLDDAQATLDEAVATVSEQLDVEAVECPSCGGEMWDNRQKKQAGKYSPKAPDYACKEKSCDGVIWPAKPKSQRRRGKASDKAQEVAASV